MFLNIYLLKMGKCTSVMTTLGMVMDMVMLIYLVLTE